MAVYGRCSSWMQVRDSLKVKKKQFFLMRSSHLQIFSKSCTYFILKCMEILESQDHVFVASKSILAVLQIHSKKTLDQNNVHSQLDIFPTGKLPLHPPPPLSNVVQVHNKHFNFQELNLRYSSKYLRNHLSEL